MRAKLFAGTAYVVGVAGAGLFFLWVLAMGAGIMARAEPASDKRQPLLINTALILAFAIQHSGMSRLSFKRWSARWISTALERSVYVAASGIAIVALTILWQPLPGEPIWQGPIWIVAVSLLASSGLSSCCAAFNHKAFFGLTQAWTGAAQVAMPLRIVGPYRYVRHPLMIGVLIALWAQPIMPPELFMLNVGMTIYILLAIPLEERGLVRTYGEVYVNYQREVPMLIPWKWW